MWINSEELIGRYCERIDHFLCEECFEHTDEIDTRDYEPIQQDKLKSEDLLICDNCGAEFCGY